MLPLWGPLGLGILACHLAQPKLTPYESEPTSIKFNESLPLALGTGFRYVGIFKVGKEPSKFPSYANKYHT